jgi:hypothetical protein
MTGQALIYNSSNPYTTLHYRRSKLGKAFHHRIILGPILIFPKMQVQVVVALNHQERNNSCFLRIPKMRDRDPLRDKLMR